MNDLSYAESIIVAGPPDTVCDMVSDVTRMGEWSPICRACWWDEEGGTELTESWDFLPAGIAGFHQKYGDEAETQIDLRSTAAHRGIPETLAAIKKTAESA
jgi:hypothetical protein